MREIYGFGENRGAFTLTGKPLRLMVVFASLLIFACSKPLDPSLRMGAGEQGSTCSVTNSSSCHLPIKILSQSPSSIQVLRGNRVHLSVMVQGFQLSFQWYKNSQLLPNEKGSALEISAAEDLDAGAYQLQVSDGYGVQLWSNEMTIEIAEVTQNFKPIITSGPMDLTVNENQTATFTVEMTANPAPSYQWYFEGMPLQGKTTNSLTIQNVTVSDSGEYHVVLENALGKTTSRFATLRVQACDPKGKKIMDFASVLANSVLAGWPITHLTDGNLASAYSSQKTGRNNLNDYQIQTRFSSPKKLVSIKLFPRLDGNIVRCFPATYTLYGALDSSFESFELIGSDKMTTQPVDTDPVVVNLTGESSYYGILLDPQLLSPDQFDAYYLQLGEIEVYEKDPSCL